MHLFLTREPAVAMLTALRLAIDSGELDDEDTAHVADSISNLRILLSVLDQGPPSVEGAPEPPSLTLV